MLEMALSERDVAALEAAWERVHWDKSRTLQTKNNILPTTEPQRSQLSEAQAIAAQNSPISYGLGSFGLESLHSVFVGFYMFYYIDELGLAVVMAQTRNRRPHAGDAALDRWLSPRLRPQLDDR